MKNLRLTTPKTTEQLIQKYSTPEEDDGGDVKKVGNCQVGSVDELNIGGNTSFSSPSSVTSENKEFGVAEMASSVTSENKEFKGTEMASVISENEEFGDTEMIGKSEMKVRKARKSVKKLEKVGKGHKMGCFDLKVRVKGFLAP